MNEDVKTIIMAGGKGTRIQEVDSSVPKPLIPVAGKPILQWEIESLVAQGFKEIILTVSHMAEKIQAFFGDGLAYGAKITYYLEEIPLGNAGALFKLWESHIFREDEDFVLLNADSMFDVDFERFHRYHKEHGGLATLFTHPNSHPYDSGLIIANADKKVDSWLTKEDNRPLYYKNRVNAGLHIINTDIFKTVDIDIPSIGSIDEQGRVIKVDLDRQVLKPLAGTGKLIVYDSPEYVKDMGTPERFKQVTRDLISGKVQKRNLKEKQRAIFLDRDGTINKYVGFLKDINDFELLPGVVEAIKLINASGYLAIVVTNQPVIARGELTISQLDKIHNKMETLLGQAGAYIDALYYCPHHPDKGFEGEIQELKFECDCRKPKPGLILQAAADYNISLKDSWTVGDAWIDVECGFNSGTHTVLIDESGEGDKRVLPDYIEADLLSAVERILN